MDSLPPQLMNEFPWQSPQMQPSSQAEHPLFPGPGQHHPHSEASSSEKMMLNASIGGPYEAIKSEHPDEAFSALMSAPSFHSPVAPDAGEARHAIGYGHAELAIDTSPSMMHANMGDGHSHGFLGFGPAGDQFANGDSAPSTAHPAAAPDEYSYTPEPSDSQSRKRHRLRPEQTRKLLDVFARTNKPDSDLRKSLGRELGMTPRTVQIWFQNRRAKMKRESNSAGPSKPLGRYGPNGRNRLTFNNTYLNRRPPGRVVSDNLEHMRNANAFTPFPQEGFYGLPLQNPSQISVPLDISMQFPFSGPGPHGLEHGAMGIPVGQHGNGEHGMHSHPDHGMGQALNSVLPMGTHGNGMFPDVGHVHAGEPLGLANGHPMPLPDGVPSTMLHPHNPQDGADGRSGRMRSFTTDSHTLTHIGHIAQNAEFGLGAPGDQGLVPAFPPQQFVHDGQQPPPGHLPGPSLPAMPSAVSSDIPSAEMLYETRRRHLRDLIIINQTHAAREMQAEGAAPTTSAAAGATGAQTAADSSLLLSELSQPPELSAGILLSAAPMGNSNPVSACAPELPLSNSTASPERRAKALSAHGSMADISHSAATDQSVVVSADGGAKTGDLPERTSRQSSMLGDQPADDFSAQLFGQQPLTQSEPVTATGDGASQFQILHDILMQYNNMEFAGGCSDSGLSSKATDESLFMSLAQTTPGMAADHRQKGAGVSQPTQGAGLDAGTDSLNDLSHELFGSAASSRSGKSGSIDANLPASAFMVAASAAEKTPSQPKPDSNVISVASGGSTEPREVMIEQMNFSTMPF
ncbi:hypothetical protein LPJ63_001333 [Coemansia sp. RSA 2711]|nr:hypothetical protein LPJ63_001333 [Coemansia sp. RSA 2711]